MTATLYGDLRAAGVPISNHESDLYFADSADSRAILARWPDKDFLIETGLDSFEPDVPAEVQHGL